MLDFPSNPGHNEKFTSGIIEFWYDQNVTVWSRAPVTSLPPMALRSLEPYFALVNAPDFLLTATGTSFVADCVIQVSGNDRTTTFVSDTELTATISAAGAAGESPITVHSAAEGKTTSALPFTWADVITIATIDPTAAVLGDPDFLLTVTGTNFTADCVIDVNGVEVPTTVVSDTELTTTMSSLVTDPAAIVPINVYAPDSLQTTSTLDFSWVNAPILTSMAPDTAPISSVTVNLVVTGEHFSSVVGENTVIYQDGKALPNTVVASATSCSVTIVAPRLPQTEEITVANGAIATRSPPLIFTWT